MSLQDLKNEVVDFNLTVEEVLNGMDVVITNLNNRIKVLEEKVRHLEGVGGQNSSDYSHKKIMEIEERLNTLAYYVMNKD